VILRDYSQPQRLGTDMNAPCKTYGWPNMVVRARAEATFYPEHVGPLSLKTVRVGRELNEVGRARFAVTPGRYLLLNGAQTHAHETEAGTEVFSLMFRAGLAGEVFRSLALPHDTLLDAPTPAPTATADEPAFFERTYPDDAVLKGLLGRLSLEVSGRNLSGSELEERFHPILARLFVLHCGVLRDLNRMSAARFSTREELYRRLWRAREFIEACFTERVTLRDIAAAADLSPHHLLRLFKAFFGETPHQLVTKRRLGRAEHLLLTTHRSVTDICFDVGFESLGSFSTLFKARLGVSPALYRAAPLRAA
jgi:AraC family transcriptional regulator